MTPPPRRDHGGGIDAAIARHGGSRAEWLDLSTGINPHPYAIPRLPGDAWTALPDRAAADALEAAARSAWSVPHNAAVLAAPGASALIARIPCLAPAGTVEIRGPTYNEHAAAFGANGWQIVDADPTAQARVAVHPNNPDGRFRQADDLPEGPLTVIDESFADTCPGSSLIALATRPNTLVLKSFGKFWGLAGLRLGFAIGTPDLVTRLAEALGPWPVSGPALGIGATALRDAAWAEATRARLAGDAARLDWRMQAAGASVIGGTTLFRLYETPAAEALADRLARAHILVRTFPYDRRWLRLGLPGSEADWTRLDRAL